MRSILNISLPLSLAQMVRNEVQEGDYSSVSEFVRELIRDWSKKKAINEVLKSEEDFKKGNYKVLKSLSDLR